MGVGCACETDVVEEREREAGTAGETKGKVVDVAGGEEAVVGRRRCERIWVDGGGDGDVCKVVEHVWTRDGGSVERERW